MPGDRHAAHQALIDHDLLLGEDRIDLRRVCRGRLVHDANLLLAVRVADVDAVHEPVELGLRQGIGSLVLNRVLSRHHKKGRLKLKSPACRGDRAFLHRFQQRGLRLGRCAIDLVRQDQVGEQRPFDEPHHPLPCLLIGLEDLRACDVGGHEVGCELDAFELPAQTTGQGFDQQRLGQARHADDQCVTARKEDRQQLFDDLALTDDDAVHFCKQRVILLLELLRERDVRSLQPGFLWFH